jgi:uncharacterized protein YoxC
MKEKDGIVMANGVVLKDGLNAFKPDRTLVEKSLSHVAKMSKGLYSGILNDDAEFIKFQEESMDGIIKKETDKVCHKVVTNAEKNLHRLSNEMALAADARYVYGHRSNKEVVGIDLETGNFKTKVKKAKSDYNIDATKLETILEDVGDNLASFNSSEIEILKKTTDDIKKRKEKKMKVVAPKKTATKKKAKKRVRK